MLSPSISPSQILDSYRKSDAVLIVCQDNTRQLIEIAAINEEAARVLSYSNDDLVGKPLAQILPERVSSTLTEYVEFKDDKNDLLAVLGKIRNFSVKTHGGEEIEFRLRVIRGEAIDRNPWFHLVLIDEEKLRKTNAFREMLKENFKGHEIINEQTNLPDRASLIKDLELVVYHVRNQQISASLAVLDINGYDGLLATYGKETCDKLHRHIGAICKMKLRPEDTIGTLSDRTLGLILVDASQEACRMVLNRLRWAIGTSPLQVKGEEVVTQVNVGFAQIDGKIGEQEALRKCETFIEEMRGQSNNMLQLVLTHERREETDRRKQHIPVTPDRRKKQRRSRKK